MTSTSAPGDTREVGASQLVPLPCALFMAIAWRDTSDVVIPKIGAKNRLTGPLADPVVRRAITLHAL